MNAKLGVAVLVLAAMAPSVFSETADSAEPSGVSGLYLGVKGGAMSISRDIPFKNDGILFGVIFGYDIPDSGFSLEGEFNTTVSKASSTHSSYGDLGATTVAGYGVYRTSGRFYAKGKVGVLYEHLTSSVSGIGITIDVAGDGLGLSLGIGGGVKITDRMSAELEYTIIEADIGYASLGFNWDM